jgi:hypothetical protein
MQVVFIAGIEVVEYDEKAPEGDFDAIDCSGPEIVASAYIFIIIFIGAQG